MRRAILAALAASAAISFSSPAFADPPNTFPTVVDACTAGFVSAAGSNAIACVGYYGGNMITGNAGDPITAGELSAINLLLSGPATNSTGAYSPPYSLPLSTILAGVTGLGGATSFSFGQSLSGLTIIGAHFGNSPDAGSQTDISAFWLFNITNPVGTNVVFNLPPGTTVGSSNAQLYTVGGGAVPEPATWALMLLGFTGVGFALRRQRKPALAQLA